MTHNKQTKKMEITKTKVRKLLKTVDAGLSRGLGNQRPGEMCVEAAVCYALDLPHGDWPRCVGAAVLQFKIRLNDSDWSSNAARAAGMRKVAVAQLGSDQIDQKRFIELVILKMIQKLCPPLFAGLAKLAKTDEDRDVMESAGRTCAAVMSLREADTVRTLTYALDLARVHDLARALDLAHTLALDLDPNHALDLARDLAHALAHTLTLDRDETLTMIADICLEVLVEMESPGCQWLSLCEVEETA